MMQHFLTVYVFFLVAIAFAAGSMIASHLVRPQVLDPIKPTTYECGMNAIGSTEIKTNVRFYLYALLFAVFDVEALFIYPWAVGAREFGNLALLEMLIFLGILFVGWIYAWRKGALNWE